MVGTVSRSLRRARSPTKPPKRTTALDADRERSRGIQVIARAAEILRVLEHQPEGLSLGQIARAVGLARSTVQRIVGALAAEDFVTAVGPNGGARIGAGLVRLAASVGSNVVELLRPHLRALGDAVGETVDLSVLSGGSAVFVDQVPGRQRLVALSAVGERFPLHCTANGKAMLACFSDADARELVEKSLMEHPGFAVRDRAALARTSRQRARPIWPMTLRSMERDWHRAARPGRQPDCHFDPCAFGAFCRGTAPYRRAASAIPRAYQVDCDTSPMIPTMRLFQTRRLATRALRRSAVALALICSFRPMTPASV